jgi:hypothetical protein
MTTVLRNVKGDDMSKVDGDDCLCCTPNRLYGPIEKQLLNVDRFAVIIGQDDKGDALSINMEGRPGSHSTVTGAVINFQRLQLHKPDFSDKKIFLHMGPDRFPAVLALLQSSKVVHVQYRVEEDNSRWGDIHQGAVNVGSDRPGPKSRPRRAA